MRHRAVQEQRSDMQRILSLNGNWGLTYADGPPIAAPWEFTTLNPAPARRLMTAEVPEPVHRTLEKHGLLDDPNFGMNSLRARWVEECYWIYRRTFTAPAGALGPDAVVHLVFERLEMLAKVYLNGELAGSTANALVPHRIDVTGKLREGENTLVVALESGVFEYCDHPSKISCGGEMGDLTKRAWLRKAQHQSGWDWQARLQNVGILGDVRLEYAPDSVVTELSLVPLAADDLSSARIIVKGAAEGRAVRGTLKLRIAETGDSVEESFELPEGHAQCAVELTLDRPKLWFPRGAGEPFRYTAEIEFLGKRVTRKFGVRKVAVDQSEHPVEGTYFILEINNRRIFCKGGNFVPADLYYSEVDAGRCRELVRLAAGANFNLLRIWGGGIYATEEFCDACDEAGIMLWHDFIFACAKYPGENEAFSRAVRKEALTVVRALNHHPSLVVWCGNNELELGNRSWRQYCDCEVGWSDHYIFHHLLAKVVHDESPQVFYWPSSPYSPGFKEPSDPTTGDQHPWKATLETPGGTDFWTFRSYVDRFPNEGGVLGCSTPATLRQFLPENERELWSFSWDHHDNPFARLEDTFGSFSPERRLGHAYSTVELWTGLDPRTLPMERYAVVSGLLQAEGLEEYIMNYRRRMFSTASAIFWMYNDSWPVTHGWTIVDCYRRKKLAYYPVKRAFAPVAAAVVSEHGSVKIFGVNDTFEPWSGELRCGVFQVCGGIARERTIPVELAPDASTLLAEFPKSEWEAAGSGRSGVFAQLLSGGRPAAQHRLFERRFGELGLDPDPEIRISRAGNRARFESGRYVWRVCLDIDGECELPDNAFDLIPGVPYEIPWDREELPVILTTGNSFFGGGVRDA